MLPSHLIEGSVKAHPFDAIRSIEFANQNILTGDNIRISPLPALTSSPHRPLLQRGLDRLVEIILQEGQP